MNNDLIRQLFDDHSLWHANLVRDYGRLPRTVTGVSVDGKQFLLIVEELNFNHVERHKFIKTVLESEKSTAFAYGSLVIATTTDESNEFEEQLEIVAANSRRYICGSWRVIRDSDGFAMELQHLCDSERDNPEKYPLAWFLTDAPVVSKSERLRYETIWSHIRNDARFTNRKVVRQPC